MTLHQWLAANRPLLIRRWQDELDAIAAEQVALIQWAANVAPARHKPA